MKSTTIYKLYISYGKDKWYDLKRDTDDLNKAFRTQEHIAKEHSKTTKLAIVEVETTWDKDSMMTINGTSTFIKPKKTTHCKTCKKRRFRKNINPKTGVCLTCEMRAAADESQAELGLRDAAIEELV